MSLLIISVRSALAWGGTTFVLGVVLGWLLAPTAPIAMAAWMGLAMGGVVLLSNLSDAWRRRRLDKTT